MGLLETAAELGPRRVRRLFWLVLTAISTAVSVAFFGFGFGGGGHLPTAKQLPDVGGVVSSLCAQRQAVAAGGGTVTGTSGVVPASELSGLGPGIASELRGLSCSSGNS